MTAGKQLYVFEVAKEIEQEKKQNDNKSRIDELTRRRDMVNKQIAAIDEYVRNTYDDGLGDVEDRNERNSLLNELRDIDNDLQKLYKEQIQR